ncbi:MAG: trifolitoxin immunity protein, partial [Actinomycetota bacterium]|nr:trifolitoxin immunity protein [Actinomycetota bacterium]
YAAWQFLDMGGSAVREDPPEAARRARLMADAYGMTDAPRRRLIDVMLVCMEGCWRGIGARAAAGNEAMQRLVELGVVAEVRDNAEWTVEHRSFLDAAML